MDQHELYEDAVLRLLTCGYEVLSDGSGYRVQHLTDRLDISLMRHISDLVDFANLIGWAEQRRNGMGGEFGFRKPKNHYRMMFSLQLITRHSAKVTRPQYTFVARRVRGGKRRVAPDRSQLFLRGR